MISYNCDRGRGRILLHLFTPRHQGQSTGERLFTIIVKPSMKSPTSHTPTPPLVMPTEPGAHEGGLNLSPGRPRTWFSGVRVRCLCFSNSPMLAPPPRAPRVAPIARSRHTRSLRRGRRCTGELGRRDMAHIWVWGVEMLSRDQDANRTCVRPPLGLALRTVNLRRTCSLRVW